MRLCGPDAAAAFSLLRTFSTLSAAKDGDGQRFFVQTMRTGRYLRCVQEKKTNEEKEVQRGVYAPRRMIFRGSPTGKRVERSWSGVGLLEVVKFYINFPVTYLKQIVPNQFSRILVFLEIIFCSIWNSVNL